MINKLVALKKILRNGAPKEVIEAALNDNSWFTEETINSAIQAICDTMLNKTELERWSSKYSFTKSYNIGVIAAGNIPLVGFYDILAVIVSKSTCYYKPSSKDSALINWIVSEVKKLDNDFKIYELTDNSPLDAIIATGSDNTNRYFKSKYGDLKALYRGTRTSVAIITNQTTDKEIEALHGDIFTYWGLGCRNVSHLYVENGFDLNRITLCFSRKKITFKKYINNYLFTRAEKVINKEKFIDGGYYIIKENDAKTSALSEITYSFFDSIKDVECDLQINDSKIQCVVNNNVVNHKRGVQFGKAQMPELEDAPNSQDVLKFISNSCYL